METTTVKYTLITGASEGLGKAMAIKCAEKKRNLILVALPGIELYQLASYIRNRYKVQVCEFEMDLSQENKRLYLWRTIKENNLLVDMLINNAGIGGTCCFSENNFAAWEKHIEINITNTVHLTHLFLPELKRNKKSYLLNVSSLAIFFYLPQKQVYGATKSFIYFFSKSLRHELKNDGVSVSVVCPGGINSNPKLYLLNHLNSWLARSSALSPEEVATSAIDGLLKGKERIIPGKLNHFFLCLNKILPAFIKHRMIGRLIQNFHCEYAEALLHGNHYTKKQIA